MACSSGGDMNNEEVVVGQWLDPSQQNKSEHNSNLMLFAVEYVHGQDGVVTEQLLSTRNYPTYSHGESQQFVDISESDFHGAPPTTDHMDSAPPPRTIPSSHIEEGENFYPHSSSHAISPPPLQYTQSTSDGLSQTFSSSDSFLQLSSEQCAEMLKSGVAVKLELVLPNGSLAYGVMEPVTKSINVQIPNEFLHTLRSQHAQVAVDITPSTEPDNTEGRRFDFQLQLTHDPTEVRRFDSLQDSNSGKRFEPHVRGTQEESRFETGHEGRRYEAHHTDPPHARRFDHLTEVVSSRIESHFRGEFESRRLDMSDSRSGEFQSHARVFDSEPYNTHTPLSDRNYETHPDTDRNLKTHTQLSRNLETHTQLSGNIEMHSQLSRNVESHSQQGRNVDTHIQQSRNMETHSQLSRNVEAHPQLSRSFEDHSQPDRNFDTPPQTDTRTFETLTVVRNFDTNDGRDRTSQPLDCSTSLNAIDHRLEEIRIIQESLEGDSLEPSLLEEGLLSRLDAECLLSICDKPVPSRAKATLPASFLYFATVPGCAEECVFAQRRIPKFSRFGPVEGILIEDVISSYELEVKRESLNIGELFHLIEVEPGRFRQLDVSDQEASNWMRFVRPARNVQEQNLTLHQKGNAIYFTSIKDVRVKQELKVWYSQDYAQKRCLPSLEQQAAAPSYLSELLDGRLDRSEKCPHCDDYFTKEDLREHIISVHNAPCQAPDPSTKLSPPPSLVKLPSLPLPSLPLLPDVKEEERDEFDRIDFCQKKVRISERIASQKLTPHTVLTSQGSVLTSQGTLLTPQGSVLTSQAGVLTSQGTVLTPPGMSRLVLPRELPAEVMPEAESTPVQEGSTEEDTYLVVSKRKTHECTMCPKVFPKGFNLKRHILSHLPEQRYPCQFCQKNFTQELYRDKHIRNVHSSEDTGVPLLSPPPPSAGEEGWVCEKCAVRFEAADMFLLHMQSHDNDHTMGNDENKLHNQHKSPIHQCPECNDQFMTKDQVLRHIMKAHSHREKHLHVCERCSRAFHSQESLERHIAMANDTNLPFRCVECCKRFSTAIALQGHVRVHGNPSFQCPMCEIQFESLQWMRSHIKTHLVNGVYHCPRCPRKFTEYQVIRKHIRTFHSDRQFACHMCIKVFPSQDKLRMHMLRHSDHREFLCANCGKQFKRKDKLKEHMVRQHNPDENQSKELPAPPPPHPSEEREKKKILPLTNHSGANQSPRPGPGGIGGGGGRSDYAKALYKCHPCLVGFKRRGMLVNHLAARHPDIRPESVPELSMPILKTARDYYCQYCDKIYKSSSKRKSHILKNHPGQALPLSNRMKLGRSDSDELPNPSFCQTVGSISATPQQCQWCHKQYASKAKLLQHQRKKHHEDLPPELRVPRLSKQSSSEDDTSRSGVLPSTSLHPSTSGLNSTHHVDMTSTMQFDVKPDAVLFSATESFTSDSLPKEEPPSSSTPLTRKPSLRPRLMKQDRVQEEDLGEVEQEHMGERALEGGERILEGERILQEGEGGTLVEMGHEVYELTTELCPETLELLRKQFKLDTVGDALGQALEDYTSGKTLTTEQLLKLFALNGVTIVTEQPSDATTNYAVFTPYPPR